MGFTWISSTVVVLIGICVYAILKTYIKPTENNIVKSNYKIGKAFTYRDSPVVNSLFLRDEDIAYQETDQLYLVIVGHIFDVGEQKGSYGTGSGYHGFVGRDGSRAFITGEFTDSGLISDLNGLTSKDYAGLASWMEFYFKTYPFIGYHIGRFFDENGKATPEYVKFIEMQDVAKNDQEAQEAVNKEFPPCNVEWSDAKGTNVWCSDKSGGIDRDWTGFPVLFKESPDKDIRCACVRESQLSDPRISKYKGCAQGSTRCDKVSN